MAVLDGLTLRDVVAALLEAHPEVEARLRLGACADAGTPKPTVQWVDYRTLGGGPSDLTLLCPRGCSSILVDNPGTYACPGEGCEARVEIDAQWGVTWR